VRVALAVGCCQRHRDLSTATEGKGMSDGPVWMQVVSAVVVCFCTLVCLMSFWGYHLIDKDRKEKRKQRPHDLTEVKKCGRG
jgi:hypothetical protein